MNRHGVVDPRLRERVAQLAADDAEQLALARGYDAAAGTGVVGDGVDHVDVPVVGDFVDATTAVQFRVRSDDAALHRHRLVAGGDLELIAECQHPVAGSSERPFGGLGDIEIGQVVYLFELEEGDVQLRLGDDHFGLITPPI